MLYYNHMHTIRINFETYNHPFEFYHSFVIPPFYKIR